MYKSLERAPQLHRFILHGVTSTKRVLGKGAYGIVEELEWGGRLCAGKKIFDILLQKENEGVACLEEKYIRECSLLSDLQHSNIVTFLGICFLPDVQLPVLVMERMQRSLDDVLETKFNIPFSTKLCILQDVANGLEYMHNHSPPVIHRDLTARNVLLNSDLVAKIADLGNSRIVDIPPGELAQTMTQGIPGTLVYMPPEVLGSTYIYGPPLDIFSFGHLTLFTAIQIFPKELDNANYINPTTQKIEARTELERRKKYIDLLDMTFGKAHTLSLIIKDCLAYGPEKRPTARQVHERLETMSVLPILQSAVMISKYECVFPNIRACPECGAIMEHTCEKSKFVQCVQCSVSFCFVCLELQSTCLATNPNSWYTPCSRCTPPIQTHIPRWIQE
jgi:serine/threonine protein kinase